MAVKKPSTEDKRVLAATIVGTSIEWYDYLIYAQSAALIFGPLFFTPATRSDPDVGQIFSLATIGIAFLFRPLGAVICGYLGDRFGRRAMLVITLTLIGSATGLIGLLPTYASIGIWAPILLILLRILQGFSAGGEWGGAALLAVEHAPPSRRTSFGAFPQAGVPIGLLIATGAMLAVSASFDSVQMLAYGWRIPFLFSIVLTVTGWVIRQRVEESPVFKALQSRRLESKAPLREVFKSHFRLIWQSALICVGNSAAGYLFLAFTISYGQSVLNLPVGQLLSCSIAACLLWLVSTFASGWIGDRIGAARTLQIGYLLLALWAVPMWLLIDTATISSFLCALLVLAIPLGLSYGPQAAVLANLFPAEVRYSGISTGYALGSILGGAFAPTIAQAIMSRYHHSFGIGIYIAVFALISLAAVTVSQTTSKAHLEDTVR
ncbi:MFS family permease [Variovorax ginsengisoli]|uniref:MFS family permease n=1 Tax=Variovorax ginsengisoli TaxID=363844 RepID=A0ABT9SC79_9BURK|nr:MFS family permease [Variovorax ginsengisoli]